MLEFTHNGKVVSPDADPYMPLLWWLRDTAGLSGTKYGRGIGSCGACTVNVDGEPTRAALLVRTPAPDAAAIDAARARA